MLRKTILAAVSTALLASAAFAQSSKQTDPADERGLVSFSEFSGTFDSSGHVAKLDSWVGYNLSEHFGADFGVPLYLAGGSVTSTTGSKTSFSATGMGAPYIAVRAMYKDDSFRYAGRFAIYLPAGDATAGLSTGQTSIDWTNRFENSFGRVTPFGSVGIANTVNDMAHYNRPYTSYGNNFHLEGGTDVDITNKVSVGGSLYDVFPWGTQTIYSRAVPKGSIALPAQSNGKSHAFQQNSFFAGGADLAKDDGVSFWTDYSPVPYLTAEAAFTRSIEFAMNSASITLRFNVGYLAKARSRQ